MNETQINHLNDILSWAIEAIGEKYERGTKEHKGNLTDVSKEKLIEAIIEEAIDLLNYAYTLREKL